MKQFIHSRHILALMLIAALSMAGCSAPNDNAAAAQAKVDSIVSAKTAAIRAQMQRSNDSLIEAKAVQRADSMFPAKQAVRAK